MKKIRVVELFAGVGGFRLGLDSASKKDKKYETVWSSQWEPGATIQYASEIYIQKFGNKGHSCQDIQEVVEKDSSACVIRNSEPYVAILKYESYITLVKKAKNEDMKRRKIFIFT